MRRDLRAGFKSLRVVPRGGTRLAGIFKDVRSRRIPVLTLLMVGGALVVALVPGWARWLVYDRSAILSGQFWRLFTGHWVHFSTGHLVWDLIPFGVAAGILEVRGTPRFGWFCLLTPWVISAAAPVFEPQMSFCGGLSGMGCAMITLLALQGLAEAGLGRWICVAALVGIAGKTLVELASGHSVFVTINGEPVIVSVANHIAGAGAALVFYGLSGRPRHFSPGRSETKHQNPSSSGVGGSESGQTEPVIRRDRLRKRFQKNIVSILP